MKIKFPTVAILALSVVAGCAWFEKTIEEPTRYDQVLVYERPYDFTYLKTLEALNTFPDWVLQETDKEKGIIEIRNTQYGHIFDRDKWTARFNVKRLDRKKTSVSLDPSTQTVERGKELLDRIDQVMNAAPQKLQPQTAR